MTHKTITCPHCGRELRNCGSRMAAKHIAACAKRPPQTELLRMYRELGQAKLVAAELGVSGPTVCRWLRGGRHATAQRKLTETGEPLVPLSSRFGKWGGCDASCEYWSQCQTLPGEWPTPCMAVTPGDVRLLVNEYDWTPPAHVARAISHRG